jgi:hypothetical protein
MIRQRRALYPQASAIAPFVTHGAVRRALGPVVASRDFIALAVSKHKPICRSSQRFAKIRVVNLHYDDTVEAAVYKVLRERIKLFGDVVGKLQPILSQVAGQITKAVLTTEGVAAAETIVENIERNAAQAEAAAFDLDSLLGGQPIDEVRAAPLYDLGTLRQVLRDHEQFLPDIRVEERSEKELFYQGPGMNTPNRVTASPEYYEDHLEDVELWSPGNPLFPWVSANSD